MRYIYGPVHSRRLGRSLGIDPIPLKTCNWNCVYCQLGRTVPLTDERREYIPTADIEEELARWLATHDPEEIDWISIVGSGEPTLHTGIGRLVLAARRLGDVPLAVITNGSLLYLPEVREALLPADAVMPTLAVGTAAGHRRLHRPHPQATFERQIEGLITFRREYAGKLLVEVMVVAGLNDQEAALHNLADLMRLIRPDGIDLTTPVRPPAEPWVTPPEDAALARAAAILGQICPVFFPPGKPAAVPSVNGRDGSDLVDSLLGLLRRHPLGEREFARRLAAEGVAAPGGMIAELIAAGQVQRIRRGGIVFLTSPDSRYPPEKAAPA